jgi:hypothetical protein
VDDRNVFGGVPVSPNPQAGAIDPAIESKHDPGERRQMMTIPVTSHLCRWTHAHIALGCGAVLESGN